MQQATHRYFCGMENTEEYRLPVTFVDGEHILDLVEVGDNEYYMRWYKIAHTYYRSYYDEIRKADCFVVIDMTDKPKFWLRHPSGSLPDSVSFL